MRVTNRILMPALAFAAFSLFSCDAMQTIDVTLDVTGSSLAAFTGFYETTTNGQASIAGVPPKSYTFKARKKYDVVAAQIVYAGTGALTARLVSGGVTRDSSTISYVGTITLHWTPK
jgi:hypothetical protein